jgi:hypothetical protein
MQIKPPYGYQEIVPLDKKHRVLLPEPGRVPAVFRRLAALPLSYGEFAAASRDYPIAFVSGDGGASFVAMAVLGLEPEQNLFATEQGGWDARAYLPAYVRRYPFCMTRVTVDGREQPERIACVEKRALDDGGAPLYDEKGEPLPAWEERRKLLFEYETDLVRSEEMCRALAELGLFETFTVQAVPREGAALALTGMYRVAEAKLNELAAERLRELVQRGILGRVYAHLLSLANFGRLLERRAALPRSEPAASA